MKKLILFIFLPLTLIFAQTEEEKPIDLSGKFALMFQIDRNFDLTNFDGLSFSGKYHFTNRFSVRLGIGVSYTLSQLSSKVITEQHYKYGDSVFVGNVDTDQRNYYVGLNFIYNQHFHPNWNFYLGGGPFIEYEKYRNKYAYAKDIREVEETINSYGVELIFGVEYFLSDTFSLIGEYGMRFSTSNSDVYTLDSRTDYSTGFLKETGERSRNGIREIPVKLGVSIYF